ncbi:nickel import ATP-binding protein NikE [Paenibacillus enshidis]|uniref:Nickel import ATP-binding protein NikE n=1 Tax=Paenibacillus enshidis TaxID=1458439 RepID=A0ABV5AWA5_9BACL
MSLLQVKDISHAYRSSKRLWRSGSLTAVLSKVSFAIEPGQCLGLLGTSGAGKSTLGKVILGMERPRQGRVIFQGHDLYNVDPQTARLLRRDLQVVFQDCYSSVNPRMTAEQIIAEPLDNYENLTRVDRKRRVGELLEAVGLKAADMQRYPHTFSGGQLQRINIARAIALKPKLIVLDEPVSSLDMVNQTRILTLLSELKATLGLSYLFITHDVKAAHVISDSLAVMKEGRIVELCSDKNQLAASTHPAVCELYASVLPEHPRDRLLGREASGPTSP